jgi:hypothetical protein
VFALGVVGAPLMVAHVVWAVMIKQPTGVCESCGERKPTEVVMDDWTTVIEYYELCSDCRED